ncbi:hypothetical protein B0H34DRAFT_723495 [Crassisporium funariophilum]|nr:hypothetical protein B0H34DRAFT_723495 [Crassisporium funariophilum]
MSSGRRSLQIAAIGELDTGISCSDSMPRAQPHKASVINQAGTSVASTESPSSQNKRKREEISDDEPRPSKSQQTYVKHADHWLLDGNVLLQIGNTRFRLHRSRLAIQSVWFRHLFESSAGRSGNSAEAYANQHEIDRTVASAEVVEGCDLFYLDFPDNGERVPSPAQFAVLLSTMDKAIQYAFERPAFDLLQDILVAAQFYEFTEFASFAERGIKLLFSNDVADLTGENIPNAGAAVDLARWYEIKEVLPCAFYQLARRQPVSSTKVGETDVSPSDEDDPLVDLGLADCRALIDIQKHLALAWDGIIAIMESKCPQPKCSWVDFPSRTVFTIKRNHPFDPLIAIEKLIKHDWHTRGHCTHQQKAFVTNLEKERGRIWDGLKIWTSIST